MNDVADSSSLNKPNKFKFKYMHAYFFFQFFYFLGLGPAQPIWAGLDPASPAWSLAQASDPAGPRHACVNYSRMLCTGGELKLPPPYTYTTINEREWEAYLEAGTKTMTKAWSASCFLPLLLFFFRFTSVFGFLCLVSSCPSPVLCVFPSPMALCFCSSSLYYLCSCVLLCSRCYFLSGSRETET